MNFNKINKTIDDQYKQQLEKVLSNISQYYKINKKELFDKFLHKPKSVKVYKNKKKILDPEYKCMGRKQDGTQCSRGRKFGDYCGKHNPPKFGRIDEPMDNSLFKKKKHHIIVQTEQIQNKEYIIEASTNILFDNNIKQPTVIGKKLTDNSIYFIDEHNLSTKSIATHTSPESEENNIIDILSKLANIDSSKDLDTEFNDFTMNPIPNKHENNILNHDHDEHDEHDEHDDNSIPIAYIQ